jgi:Flp pilus assembly protein TadG
VSTPKTSEPERPVASRRIDRRHRRRGNYAILVGLCSSGILGLGALAVDTGYLHLVEAQAQAISDAAAHAALVTLKLTGDVDDARDTAHAFVNSHELVGKQADVDSETDIVFGGWDFDLQEFDESASYVNSVQVTVRKTEESVNGSFGTLMMGMFGTNHQNAQATTPAIGAMRFREIVIVQDVTGSFAQEIDEARDADLAFLDAIYADDYPGDRIGMVTFVGSAVEYTQLDYVATNYSSIRSDWEKIDWCDRSYYPYYYYGPPYYHSSPNMMPCNYQNSYYLWYYDSGTAQATGLDEAIDMLLSSGDDYSTKVIIIISDGQPECVYRSSDYAAENACTAAREQDAYDAADWAEENNISIFSVSFNDSYNATQSAVMESLVRGYGDFYETPNPSELPDILEDIAEKIPIALVQ